MPRIFVALPVAQPVRAAIGQLRRCAVPQLRWVAEHQYHVTLRFLGDLAETEVDFVHAAVGQAVAEAWPGESAAGAADDGGLNLVARGLGAFPNPARARVVWVGLAGDVPALRRLQAAVARRLQGLGHQEERPFSPHITVARSREPIPLPQPLRGYEGYEFGRWRADAVEIIESVLTPSGPVYTVRSRVLLTAR